MHEGVIVKSLFEIAAKSREESGLKEVQKIKVVIGRFHQIVREVMEMYFNIMKKDFEGFREAILEIEERDLEIRCRNCKLVMKLKEPDFTCSGCHSINTEVIHGNELYIESLIGSSKNEK